MTGSSRSLVIRGLTKRYGAMTVLDGVDLDAPPGEVTVITGSNGSGKSTLLRCIAGLASHDGSVTFQGTSIGDVRHSIGYLPQSVGLAGWATVRETIDHFARLRGVDPADTGLPDGFVPSEDRKVGVLSGGQRQRVALAIALLGRPRLLLLDEPSANLDDSSRATLNAVLEAAAADGAIVVVATPVGTDVGVMRRDVIEIRDGRTHPTVQHREQATGNGNSPQARTREEAET